VCVKLNVLYVCVNDDTNIEDQDDVEDEEEHTKNKV
jgi:hypothetical protein